MTNSTGVDIFRLHQVSTSEQTENPPETNSQTNFPGNEHIPYPGPDTVQNHVFVQVGHVSFMDTTPKTRIEPENDGSQKEISLPGLHFLVSC